MIKRIAVIGSGISGLVCASTLSDRYSVTLFEENNYLGGHTNTVDVELDHAKYAIDTGFIVFNQKTYPYFCHLLKKYQIAMQPTEMSFSYRSDSKNLEYNGHTLKTLFADRFNLIRPQFYRFVTEIIRFNRDAKHFLTLADNASISIAQFIKKQRYSSMFTEAYLIPMISAIWSKHPAGARSSPAKFILQFYANHGLLDLTDRPQWYVVQNGSRSYIPALMNKMNNDIHLNTKIRHVARHAEGVILKSDTDTHHFDAVVIAVHGDQVLNLLADPTPAEQQIFSAIQYTKNHVVLHTDISVLPKRRLAWASWNYLDLNNDSASALTYYMNRLQSITSPHHFCVSVNLAAYIDPAKIIKDFHYDHPFFDENTLQVQRNYASVSGKNSTYYAGAYWGSGFHEDGVKSAAAVCELLGVSL